VLVQVQVLDVQCCRMLCKEVYAVVRRGEMCVARGKPKEKV
jgi:hypothetical protein